MNSNSAGRRTGWAFLRLVVALSACTPAGDSRQPTTPLANGALASTEASGGGPPCTASVEALPALPAGYRLVRNLGWGATRTAEATAPVHASG